MTSLVILSMFLSYPFLRCHSSETNGNTDDITATCFEPLGISDGRIKDEQLISLSVFDNDFETYGPHRARLNMTSWPGYRCAPEKANSGWFRVNIGHMVVITGIATQGYGDLSVSEWLTGYILLYSQGPDYDYFRERNGEIQIFLGNHDRNSIQLNQVAIPDKALSVTLMSTSFHNNFALRMELYGCKPDYYVVVRLMLDKTPFTVDYVESRIDHEHSRSTAAEVQQEVIDLLTTMPGFLGTRVQHLSPQEYETDGALLTAEVVIECFRGNQETLVTRLREKIASGKTIFDSKYFKIQYTADELNILPSVSLNLTKNLQGVTEVLPDQSHQIEAKTFSLGRVNSTLEEYDFHWEIFTVHEHTGQFFQVMEMKRNNARNITISSKQISEGLTFVRTSVRPKETNSSGSYDFGFIRILPRLTVTISGPDEIIKGGGTVELHSVTKGKLQDSFGDKAADVTFMWSCRVDSSKLPNASSSFDSSFDKNQTNHTDFLSCDNSILNSTTKESLVFNPDLLVSNRTYVFQLLVSQGSRFVTATHNLRVNTNISLSKKS